MIKEQQVRFVAAADYTDECRVDVRMRRKHMDLSPAQALAFAGELTDAAHAARRALASVVRPVEAAVFDLLGDTRGMLPPRMVRQVEEIAVDMGATIVKGQHLSPDCRAGKHPAGWVDSAWDDEADVEVPCECPCHTAGAAA